MWRKFLKYNAAPRTRSYGTRLQIQHLEGRPRGLDVHTKFGKKKAENKRFKT